MSRVPRLTLQGMGKILKTARAFCIFEIFYCVPGLPNRAFLLPSALMLLYYIPLLCFGDFFGNCYRRSYSIIVLGGMKQCSAMIGAVLSWKPRTINLVTVTAFLLVLRGN